MSANQANAAAHLANTTPFDRMVDACHADWRAYIEHPFVRGMGDGTLPEEAFRHYLKQDYLFLVHFSRAWGLAVYKSRTIGEIRQGLDILKAIVDVELRLHIGWCAEWGVSEDDLAQLQESRANMAYTRYVLDAGASGDLLDLHVALAPCVIGYGEVARWLLQQPFLKREGNPYMRWIEMYASEEFLDAANAERAWIDARMASATPERVAALTRIFRDATRLEADFWEMGLTLAD